MKKNIAIVAGGDSSEIVVSLKSADGVYSFIDKKKYSVYIAIVKRDGWMVRLPGGEEAPIDRNDFSFPEGGVVKRFDFAYIIIHGAPGENGLLQGYFDLIGMPYSSCGVLASALTFNKFVCNNYLKSMGIRVADAIRLTAGEGITDEEIVARLGLPVFVKPNDSGSSFGVTKAATPEALQPAIRKAFAEGTEVMIERYIAGTEVTCGCYRTKGKVVLFPLTEVVTHRDFFDFDAKYNGQSEEITPARISDELTAEIQRRTAKVYDVLGAKGIIRVDYIIPEEGDPVLLEVNTTPGMTASSFIPQQIRAAGLKIEEVMSGIIEEELQNVGK
ncbi:MAG: D-alanine--D-alanine ligase [Tannerellaceae bacterium]|nr:D-alanine--D-alanine ligase [Tannerellaceae bacterium]